MNRQMKWMKRKKKETLIRNKTEQNAYAQKKREKITHEREKSAPEQEKNSCEEENEMVKTVHKQIGKNVAI